MMAGFMSYFGGRRDAKQSSRDAIVTLRQQLQMIEKKGEYLQKKIDEDTRVAKANAVTNKTRAFLSPAPSFSVPPSVYAVLLRIRLGLLAIMLTPTFLYVRVSVG